MSDVFAISGSYSLVDNVSDKLDQVSKKVDDAGEKVKASENKFNKFSDTMNNIGGKMMGVGKSMTAFLTLPIMGAGAAAFNLASDYEESVNKISTAFKNNAGDVIKWGDTTLNEFGIAKGTALDMASTFGEVA